MTRDIGTADRMLRLAAGLVLILPPLAAGLAAATPSLGGASIVAGVVLLGTAALRFCPLYTPLGGRACAARP